MNAIAKTPLVVLALLGVLAAPLTAADASQKETRAAAPAPETVAQTQTKAAGIVPATQVKDLSYDHFKGVADKNIFNPYRTGRSSRASTAEAAPTGDFIALVGTMSYGKGVFAFFDSNSQSLRKVVPEGGSLGDFTVERITATGAQVSQGKQTFTMSVAQQLTRPPEGGAWTLSAAPAAGSPQPSAESASGSTEETPPIPADASDVLKRLMEKRQKQLKE